MRPNIIIQFLRLESASGIILFVSAMAALILCNSPLRDQYQQLWQLPVTLHLANFSMSHTLLFWVNEGLMTLFFLLVGLELKREFLDGELVNISQIVLPGMAALGGMLVPALFYCCFNYHNPEALQGWAVPVATDIAFALGVLSLFGKRVPLGLKLFLTALAIFDDVGAIIIIAIFYTESLSFWALIGSFLSMTILQLLNFFDVWRLTLYMVVGLLLWICVLQSGVHATVAGVLLAFFIPLGHSSKKKRERAIAPLRRLEEMLHPWVAYLVMPIFAFANAGLSLQGFSTDILFDSVVLGTVLGLFIGKQIGAFSFAWLAIKLHWAELPERTGWLQLYGVTILCGIGFTMSLFLGTLAFQGSPAYLVHARLGILIGSVLSGMVGAMVLLVAVLKKWPNIEGV